jgi:hypothetical protein
MYLCVDCVLCAVDVSDCWQLQVADDSHAKEELPRLYAFCFYCSSVLLQLPSLLCICVFKLAEYTSILGSQTRLFLLLEVLNASLRWDKAACLLCTHHSSGYYPAPFLVFKTQHF